jgi:hypothetical protein
MNLSLSHRTCRLFAVILSECDFFDFFAGAWPFGVKGRSSAFLAAAFALRCHPEPIRAKRGWVRDLLLPSLSGIPACQSFRAPGRRPPGTPISRLASRLTFAPRSALPYAIILSEAKYASPSLAFRAMTSSSSLTFRAMNLSLPRPTAARNPSPHGFAVPCHPERAKRRGISLRVPIRATSLQPAPPFRGSELQLRHNRRAAPSSRGGFSASLLSAEERFSQLPHRLFNSGITLSASNGALESVWQRRFFRQGTDLSVPQTPQPRHKKTGAQRLPLAVPFPRAFSSPLWLAWAETCNLNLAPIRLKVSHHESSHR